MRRCTGIVEVNGLRHDTLRVVNDQIQYGLSRAPRPFNSRLDRGKRVENGFESLPD